MVLPSLSLGFSPCPNDTFIFYALVHSMVQMKGCTVGIPPLLEDVETLNRWALDGKLDITKLSFHAYGLVQDQYALLHSGSALGRGCGPLLICRDNKIRRSDLEGCTVAIPGRITTAAMLFKLFCPQAAIIRPMRFDKIIPALVNDEIDAGVIIHESRFTYAAHGLHLLQDLGEWWEKESGCPIPLGGIAVRRALGRQVFLELEEAVRQSVQWAFENRELCMPYIRAHAQEMNDAIIGSHIDLYVNDFSIELGREGEMAVDRFLLEGYEKGILPNYASPWAKGNLPSTESSF
jgi:1,4-dihydroxy-6-naphthoate synthase